MLNTILPFQFNKLCLLIITTANIVNKPVLGMGRDAVRVGCENDLLCMRLEEAARLNPTAPHVLKYKAKMAASKQLFASVWMDYGSNATYYDQYPWENITRVIAYGPNVFVYEKLLAKAHSEGVPVLLGGEKSGDTGYIDPALILSDASRYALVRLEIDALNRLQADGLQMKYGWGSFPRNSSDNHNLVAFLRDLNDTYYDDTLSFIHTSLVIPYMDGVYGQYYDIHALAPFVDFFSVNAMEMESDMCIQGYACASSPHNLIQPALASYTDGLKVDPSKLVLLLPWHGLAYYCNSIEAQQALCKTNSWSVVGLDDVMSEWIQQYSLLHYEYDSNSTSPYVTLFSDIDSSRVPLFQVWYEDTNSISIKAEVARSMNIGGTGVHKYANWLDYADPDKKKANQEMWSAISIL